jgi:hypothetical protein
MDLVFNGNQQGVVMCDKNGRNRRTMRFDLDIVKPSELRLYELLLSAKKTRKYSGLVRDGIRLVHDLRNGKTDVLFELFPWIRAEIQPVMVAPRHAPVAVPDDMPLPVTKKASGNAAKNMMNSIMQF